MNFPICSKTPTVIAQCTAVSEGDWIDEAIMQELTHPIINMTFIHMSKIKIVPLALDENRSNTMGEFGFKKVSIWKRIKQWIT
jgi:hypothetical protein